MSKEKATEMSHQQILEEVNAPNQLLQHPNVGVDSDNLMLWSSFGKMYNRLPLMARRRDCLPSTRILCLSSLERRFLTHTH